MNNQYLDKLIDRYKTQKANIESLEKYSEQYRAMILQMYATASSIADELIDAEQQQVFTDSPFGSDLDEK